MPCHLISCRRTERQWERGPGMYIRLTGEEDDDLYNMWVRKLRIMLSKTIKSAFYVFLPPIPSYIYDRMPLKSFLFGKLASPYARWWCVCLCLYWYAVMNLLFSSESPPLSSLLVCSLFSRFLAISFFNHIIFSSHYHRYHSSDDPVFPC